MGENHRTYNRQAESVMAEGTPGRQERLEDSPHMLFGYPGATVDDVEVNLPLAGGCTDANLT